MSDCDACDGDGKVCANCGESPKLCECDDRTFENCHVCGGTGFDDDEEDDFFEDDDDEDDDTEWE